MKEFKGTPAPWTAVKGIFWSVENEEGYRIASCMESENVGLPEKDASEANALLLAAAPDLLDALQGLMEYVDRMHSIGHIQRPNQSCVALEAVHKALGVEK